MRTTSVPGALIRAAAVVVLTSACAARAASHRAPLPNRDVLTAAELSGQGFTTVLDAIQALRANWLETRGTNSLFTPTQVLVYLDDNQLGGVDALSSVSIAIVSYIQHYNGLAATARWGLDHGEGVIYISTHPASGARPLANHPT
jgi:hypothetical protein